MGIPGGVREVAGVAVVDLSSVAREGRITLGESSNSLRNNVNWLLDAGATNVLLNMSDVNYIDSSGLGELGAARSYAMSKRGTIKLLHVQPKVKQLMELTRMDAFFEMFEDEPSALSSFNS
jgi:anti-sigma B factor antagonist